MANARAIKQRIKSAKNISKITKAMEMVSASKMRRSQEKALMSRPYAENLDSLLQKVSQYTKSGLHPLLEKRPVKKVLLVILSTDRGLVGGLNTTLFRTILQWQSMQTTVECVTIGKKAKLFCQHAGLSIYADFSGLPDSITYESTLPISTLLQNAFLSDEFQEVHLTYMKSINTLSQKPQMGILLPISATEINDPAELAQSGVEYTIEPSAQQMLRWLLPYFIENVVYFRLLEAKASEHSARMISMKNASDNAKEIVHILSLEYNRKRQASITQELQEITTSQMTF